MKKKTVSKLKNRSIKIIQSEEAKEQCFFFLMSRISGTCETISKVQILVSDSQKERIIMQKKKFGEIMA